MIEHTVPVVLTTKASTSSQDAAKATIEDLVEILRDGKIDDLDCWYLMEEGHQHLDGNDRTPVALVPVGDHLVGEAGRTGRVLVGIDVYAQTTVAAQRLVRDGLARHFGPLAPNGDVADGISHVTNVHLVDADPSTGQVGAKRWTLTEAADSVDVDEIQGLPIFEAVALGKADRLAPEKSAADHGRGKTRLRTSIEGASVVGASSSGISGPR